MRKMSNLSSTQGAADPYPPEYYPEVRELPERPRRRGFFSAIFHWFSSLLRFILATALFFALMVGASYWVVDKIISGKVLVTPNVMGMPMWEAAKSLKTDKLSLAWDGDRPNETVPKGDIVSQYPTPGMRIKAGSALRVVISKGSPLVSVPDLRGITRQRAEVTLHNLNLKIGTIMGKPDEHPGLVVETDPPSGTGVIPGSTINLAVTIDRNQAALSMPNLTGMTLDQASKLLANYNLVITEDRRAASDKVAPGQIHFQRPAPGERVSETTRITVTYAPTEDEAPEVTPDSPDAGAAPDVGATPAAAGTPDSNAAQPTPPPVKLE